MEKCPNCSAYLTEKIGKKVCDYCGYSQKIKVAKENIKYDQSAYPIMVYRVKKRNGFRYTAYDIQYEWDEEAGTKEEAITKLKSKLEKEIGVLNCKPEPDEYEEFISHLAASEISAKIEWINLEPEDLDW